MKRTDHPHLRHLQSVPYPSVFHHAPIAKDLQECGNQPDTRLIFQQLCLNDPLRLQAADVQRQLHRSYADGPQASRFLKAWSQPLKEICFQWEPFPARDYPMKREAIRDDS